MINWKRIGLRNYTFPNIKEYTWDFTNRIASLPSGIELEDISNKSSDLSKLAEIPLPAMGEDVSNFVKSNYNSGINLTTLKGTHIEDPIYIDFKMDDTNPTLVDLNIIKIAENSQVTIVFDYNTNVSTGAFHNGLTKIYSGKNSKLNIIKIQRMNDKSYNFDSNISIIEENGIVNWISIEIGGSFSASNYSTLLDGLASESNLSSIYLGDGKRKMDLEYTMIHKGAKSKSNIQTRGVLKDQSMKVFRGNLDFKSGAKKSQGIEEEYVILMDPTVKSHSIPALLSGEDDVEGEHAVSAGQIDDSKMFYLMSRGLSERKAKKLIVEASFRPIIDKIPTKTLQALINEEVERRLTRE